MREKSFLEWTNLFIVLILVSAMSTIISCGSKDDGQSNQNISPFNPGVGFPVGGGGNPGLYNGPIFNDQFSGQIIQALQTVPCPLGRYAMAFNSGPNGQANRIFGPFVQGGAPFGQVIAAYIGGNQANGDIMVIRKLGNGFQVSGYHMELHLCIDNILVTPQRQLTNFQLRNNQPIILDQDARCAVGDIDYAPAQLTAMPGGFYNHPSPVYIGIAPLALNFCGF
jgi:hypothetical protein